MLIFGGQYGSECKMVDPRVWEHDSDTRLLEALINVQTEILRNLLENVDPKHLRGVWLDICAGNGLAAVNSLWSKGVDLLHIEQTPARNFPLVNRTGWYAKGDSADQGWTIGQQYLDGNFLTASVIDLANDNRPVLVRVPQRNIAGAVLLYPPWDTKEVNSSSVKLAKDLLPQGGPMVIVTDASGTDHIQFLRDELKQNFASVGEYPNAGSSSYGFIAYK